MQYISGYRYNTDSKILSGQNAIFTPMSRTETEAYYIQVSKEPWFHAPIMNNAQ